MEIWGGFRYGNPKESSMRKLTLSLAILAMMAPGTAMACGYGPASSVSVTCEQGVRVYRATPKAGPAAPPVVYGQRSNKVVKQRLLLQSERISAQADRIDALESQLDAANQSKSRRRIYSAPVGAFGAAPIVGRRGTKTRRRSGIKIGYNRGIRT